MLCKFNFHFIILVQPPSDEEIKRSVENFQYCSECNYKFTDFDEIFKLKTNEEFLLCEDCLKKNEKKFKIKNFHNVRNKILQKIQAILGQTKEDRS